MAKKAMGMHWCNRCKKDVKTHDGGGYLYNIWMTCQTCDECGYSVVFADSDRKRDEAEEKQR